MPRLLACLVALALAGSATAQPLQTVAEKTDYKATSRFADVAAFCEELAKASPLVKLSTFGTSQEGRKLPLLVIADPPVATPEEAAKSGKLVVLAFANIHAGEVDGKEALLMLARDLTAQKGHPLLKDLVILMVPILNADGNEKIDPRNRRSQNGPADGVGTRENAQGFDLNRDFVKLESPEIRALVKLLNTWDPAVTIDCHTTNGSRHRFTLTYDGPRYPLGDPKMAELVDGKMFPDITKRVKAATGFDISPYGNFSQDRTKWETYPASPRFGVQYVAARGRVCILSESYSYATFKDRVKASYAFVKAILESSAANAKELRDLFAKAKPAGEVVLQTKTVALPKKIAVLGYEEEVKDGKRTITDKPKEYMLDYVAKMEATLTAERPHAYLVPAGHGPAVETLRRHGIKVEELREAAELPVEVFLIRAVDKEPRPFQKHAMVKVDATRQAVKRTVPKGTMVVRTAQPLGTLAVYLLEPQSEDGLTTWNFFDKELAAGKEFPVLRLPKEQAIKTGELPPLPEEK